MIQIGIIWLSNSIFYQKVSETFYDKVFENLFNHFPSKPCFLRVYIRSRLKTIWEKEKLLVFYPFGELSAIFIEFEIVVCKLFEFGRV